MATRRKKLSQRSTTTPEENLRRRARPEAGSAALLIGTLILPLLLFLLALSFDVRAVLAERESLQRALDEAGIHAIRFSRGPGGTGAVGQAVADYLTGRRIVCAQSSVTVRPEGLLEIRCRSAVALHFADLFLAFAGKKRGAQEPFLYLPVDVHSTVRASVFDSVIAVDRSYYLAPDPFSTAAAAWGGVPSSVFTEYYARDRKLDPVIATEQCFNPVFSAMKNAAIELYSVLTAEALNSVAVSFFPGGYGASTLLRPLDRPRGFPEMDFHEHVASESEGERQFLDDERITPGNSRAVLENRFCAAAAERSLDTREFRFPDRRAAPSPDAGKPAMIRGSDWQYDPTYDAFLSGSEVIWSRAVLSNPPAQKEPDTAEVLESAFATVLSGKERPERGGLRGRAIRTIFVITGDVPRRNGIRFPDEPGSENGIVKPLTETFARLRQNIGEWNRNARTHKGDPLYVELYYLLQRSDGMNLTGRIDALLAFFERESRIENEAPSTFHVTLLVSPDGKVLTDTAMKQLTLRRRSGVISR